MATLEQASVSLRRCYDIYKTATEAALDELFENSTTTDKSCKGIEKRVKQLRSKKKAHSQRFFKNIRKAVLWRKTAGKKYYNLEATNDPEVAKNDRTHSYFIRLLTFIDQALAPFCDIQNEEEATVANIFESLMLEETLDEGDRTLVEEVEHLSAPKPDFLGQAGKGKGPLESDQLSAVLDMLASLKVLMDRAQEYCDETHRGRMNIVTTTMMLSIIYANIKSICSHQALLVDTWSDIDTWLHQAT